MKTRYYRKINKQNLSLGDLVQIISSCAKNKQEAAAALNDLFDSGRVVIRAARGEPRRLHVCT